MRVFRLENQNERGPYQAGDSACLTLLLDHTPDTHPGPTSDGISVLRAPRSMLGAAQQDLYFACPTRALLEDWFAGVLNKLERRGFRVQEYDVEEGYDLLGLSMRQLVFDRTHAVKVKQDSWLAEEVA